MYPATLREPAPIRIYDPSDEVMKRSSRRVLRMIGQNEGRAPYWYGDVNAYKRLDALAALGLVSIVYVHPGKRAQQVYLTDKGRKILDLLDDIDDVMGEEAWRRLDR